MLMGTVISEHLNRLETTAIEKRGYKTPQQFICTMSVQRIIPFYSPQLFSATVLVWGDRNVRYSFLMHPGDNSFSQNINRSNFTLRQPVQRSCLFKTTEKGTIADEKMQIFAASISVSRQLKHCILYSCSTPAGIMRAIQRTWRDVRISCRNWNILAQNYRPSGFKNYGYYWMRRPHFPKQ